MSSRSVVRVWSACLMTAGLLLAGSDGESAQATSAVTSDELPVLTVTAPVPDTVGEPDVRVIGNTSATRLP
jgi:hypothetical protein